MAVTRPSREFQSSPPSGAADEACGVAAGSIVELERRVRGAGSVLKEPIVLAGHRLRLHALEMLLISMRTRDLALRGRYERLSELWLALAERRERLGAVAQSQAPTRPIGTWRPISTAPRQEEIRLLETVWGPRIWLRDGAHVARARWRAEEPNVAGRPTDKAAVPPVGWEGLDGEPLVFAPKEWRELDD
jgi:hypothetical protein